MADEAHPGAVIVMEESRRLLERQEADLDTLRGRVGVILTGSSIVAAVFGAGIPDQIPRFAFATRCGAFALFAFTAAVCVWILLPRDWDFSTDIGEWITDIQAEGKPPTHEVVRAFARYYQEMRNKNSPQLLQLQGFFTGACILLAMQVVAWALVIVAL